MADTWNLKRRAICVNLSKRLLNYTAVSGEFNTVFELIPTKKIAKNIAILLKIHFL